MKGSERTGMSGENGEGIAGEETEDIEVMRSAWWFSMVIGGEIRDKR